MHLGTKRLKLGIGGRRVACASASPIAERRRPGLRPAKENPAERSKPNKKRRYLRVGR